MIKYGNHMDLYKTTEMNTANRLEILIMLYDGAVRFMNQAKERLSSRDIGGKGMNISKAMAIISELKNTLSFDHDQKLAGELDKLYSFVNGCLVQANIKNDPASLDNALKVMETLREAWKELETRESGDDGVVESKAKEVNSDNYFRISI